MERISIIACPTSAILCFWNNGSTKSIMAKRLQVKSAMIRDGTAKQPGKKRFK